MNYYFYTFISNLNLLNLDIKNTLNHMAHLLFFGNFNKNRCIIPNDLVEPILGAILEDDSEKLAELVSNLDDINSTLILTDKRLPDVISQQPTILSLCCFFKSIQCLNLLLNMNADPLVEDRFNRTCIHFTAAGGSLEIMRTLDQNLIFNKKDSIDANNSNNTNNNSGNNDNSSDYSSDDDYSDNTNQNNFLPNNLFNNIFFFPNQIIRQKNTSRNPYNQPDLNGLTPMHYGAMFGRLDIIRYLWTKGVKFDKFKDNRGNKPIHLACLYGHTDTVKFFIQNGEKVQSKSPNKLQPIHYACIGGYVSTIEYLISQDADINAMANSKTPIFYAARYGSLEAVKLLVKHGAKFKFKRRKTSPIVEAALGGHADIVNYFLKQGCDPNVYTSSGMTPLIASIAGNNADIVKLLIKYGAKFSYGNTRRGSGREKNIISYEQKTKNQLFKEIVQINNFSEWDCNDPLIMASRKANVEIFAPILQQIDIGLFIQEDEEISQKKKAINLCLLKLFKKDRRRNRYSQISFKSNKDKSQKIIYQTSSDSEDDDINDTSNTKRQIIENEENNDNSNMKENNENQTKKEVNDTVQKGKSKDTKNIILNASDNDSNENTNIRIVNNSDDDDEYDYNDDQKVYRKVVSLGHSSYADLIENDLFFNPHYGKRYQLCLNAIKSGSIQFLELLICNKLYPLDATELYSTATIICNKDIIKCMLKNDLPFNKTNEDLKKFILNMGSIEILQEFLKKGLQFTYDKDIKFISNVFRTYNPDFLAFVLDNIFIKSNIDEKQQLKPKKTKTNFKDSFHSLFCLYDLASDDQIYDLVNIFLENSFHAHRYSNFLNRESDEIDSLNGRDPFLSQTTRKELQQKIDEKMMIMLNILLERGHKFNPEGRMFSIPSSAHSEEIQCLFNLLKEIDKRSIPNELNFRNMKLYNLRPIFNNDIRKHKEFIDFLFAHNFSLKLKPDDQRYIQKRHLDEIDKVLTNSIQIGYYKKIISQSLDDEFIHNPLLTIKQLFDRVDGNDGDDNNKNDENENIVDQEEEEERKSYIDLIWFLLRKDTPINNHSLRMIEKAANLNHDIELASLAFKNYYNPDKSVENGHKTPLELACKRGYLEIVKDLVARGFDINESGHHDYTSPLMFAKISKNDDLIKYLESINAKPPKLNQECSVDLHKKYNQFSFFLPDFFFL